MYLKSLKLAGFKSFANPTTLRFGQHIHAIVGPNGCGKSNVIDAIRWVLGERHAKQLRGAAMSDVIFAGTEGRVGRSVASVELVLAHSQDEKNGIRHALNLYDELSIRRQVTKEGKSTYFINGQKVRRQDVVDVFLGTGLSSRGYAVIEQGMIGRITEADGQSLRRFIEEAAGVSRYQARLDDTQKQLALAKDNLARLSDVQRELKAKQKQLTHQANAACHYEKLSFAIHDKKRTLYQTKLLTAWQTHQRHLDQSQRLAKQKELLKEQLDELTAQAAIKTALIQTFDEQKEQTAHQLHQYRLDIQALEHSHKQNEATLNHAKQALTLLQDTPKAPTASDMDSLKDKLGQLDGAILLAKQQKGALADEWQNKKDVFDTLTYEHQTLKNKLAVAQGSLKQLTATAQKQPPLPALTPQSDDPHALALTIDTLGQQMRVLDQTDSQQKNAIEAQRQRIKDTGKAYDTLDKTRAVLLAEHNTLQALLTPTDSGSVAPTIAQQITLSDKGKRYAHALDGGFGFLWQDYSTIARSEQRDNCWWLATKDADETQSKHPNIIPLTDLILAPSLGLFVAGYLVDGLVLDDLPEAQVYQHLCQFVTGRPSGFVVGGRFFHRFGVMATAATALQRQLDKQAQVEKINHKINDTTAQLNDLARTLATQKNAMDILMREHSEHNIAKDKHKQTLLATKKRYELALVAAERKQLHDELAKQRLYMDRELDEQKRVCRHLSDALLALTPKVDEAKRALDDITQHRQQQKKQQAMLFDQQTTLKATLSQQQQQAAEAKLLAQKNAKLAATYHDQMATLTPTLDDIKQKQANLVKTLQTAQADFDTHLQKLHEAKEAHKGLQNQRMALDGEIATLTDKISQTQTLVAVALAKIQDHGTMLATLDDGFDLNKTLEEFCAHPNQPKADETTLKRELEELQKQLSALGAVNLTAKAELDELNARLLPQLAQTADIERSITTLQNASKTINQQSKKRFMATLKAVNADFSALFAKVFDGGHASLALDESDEVAERWQAGLVLMAQPKGKKNSRLSVLSGGEKTLTALSLIFAIFKQNPAPFCVLDEVDAPLDDANVARFTELVGQLAKQVQFIFISHNKLAMMCADQLIGITMPTAGISSVVAVDLQAAAAMVEGG